MTKTILFEQLPPELLAMFKHLTDEIQELKKMIEEGEIGVAISEAEFNLVKERVSKVEQSVTELKQGLEGLGIDPEQVALLLENVEIVQGQIKKLESYDTSSSQIISSLTERLATVEMKHVTLSLRDLSLPATTSTNLELRDVDDYLSMISWSSSHPQYITQSGIVTQPTAADGDISVVLTATAKYGSSEATKTFVISVLAADMTDDERLTVVTNGLDESIFIGSVTPEGVYVTENQVLPGEIEGVSISWQSSNEGVMTNAGEVFRSQEVNETVMLTATLVFGEARRTKEFVIIVEKLEPVPEPNPDPEIPEEPPVDPEPETPTEPEPEIPTEPEAPTEPVEEPDAGETNV